MAVHFRLITRRRSFFQKHRAKGGTSEISKRSFYAVAMAIVLIGTLTVGYMLLAAERHLKVAYQPTAPQKPPRFQFAIDKAGGKLLASPSAVTAANGRFYVGGQQSLYVYARNGRLLSEMLLNSGPRAGYTVYAHDLTVDKSGNIYAVVGPQNRILVFDKRGQPRRVFPGSRSLDKPGGYLAGPISVFYDGTKNNLLVSDVSEHAVKSYTPAGRYVGKIGRPGDKKGQFNYPNGVAAGAGGVLYVADSNNSRVQMFKDGRFVRFLKPGAGKDFVRPKAIAVDALKRVHVVDTLVGKVMVFNKKGEFLFDYGGAEGTRSGLSLPNDISIDRDTGQILIAERGNDRVSVWRN